MRTVRGPRCASGGGRGGSCFGGSPEPASRGGGKTWQELNACPRSDVCARLPGPTHLPSSPPPSSVRAPSAPPGRCGGRFPGTFQEFAPRDRGPGCGFKQAGALLRRLQGRRALGARERGRAERLPGSPPHPDPHTPGGSGTRRTPRPPPPPFWRPEPVPQPRQG